MNQVLSKKGEAFVDKLLSGKIQINMKVDTSAFIINKDNDELKYFGREGQQEIDKIKRAGSNIWEPSIEHIEKQQWEKLPNGITIATEMFNPKISTLIKWDKPPKGGMIISWIKMNGKTVPLDDRIYKDTAKLLKIAPPPVIFAGKLSTKQKKSMLALITDPSSKTGEEFTKEILGLFAPSKDIDFLYNSGFIEGVVFYFADGSTGKITDKLFTDKIMDKSGDKSSEFHELLSQTAYDNLNWAFKSVTENKRSMKKIMLHDDKDDRYIAFITALTGTIVQRVAKDMGKVDEFKDDVEEHRYSNITKSIIPKGMTRLKSKYWWSEDLFRILLYGLRKEKKRVHIKSGLTADRKNLVNKANAELKELKIL
jgi:hypothetical protein